MNIILDNVVTQNIWQWGDSVWEKRDKRVEDWPLMSSPIPTIICILMYNIFSVKVGPMLMKNRAAFNLRKVIVCYNIIMVIFNGYLVYQIWTLAWGNDYSWVCEPLDRSINQKSLNIAKCVWLYFICKYLDWLDTLFFILKKKFNHLSGLHVFHHTVMPWIGWFASRMIPGGQVTLVILLNGSVHVIMHSYYCIAALGPKYQKYLWWKKYLTMLQMIQFAVIILHGLQVFWHNCDVGIPKEWSIPFFINPILFFILFAKFYRQAYDPKQITCEDSNKNYKNK